MGQHEDLGLRVAAQHRMVRVSGSRWETVLASQLQQGDVVLVQDGENRQAPAMLAGCLAFNLLGNCDEIYVFAHSTSSGSFGEMTPH